MTRRYQQNLTSLWSSFRLERMLANADIRWRQSVLPSKYPLTSFTSIVYRDERRTWRIWIKSREINQVTYMRCLGLHQHRGQSQSDQVYVEVVDASDISDRPSLQRQSRRCIGHLKRTKSTTVHYSQDGSGIIPIPALARHSNRSTCRRPSNHWDDLVTKDCFRSVCCREIRSILELQQCPRDWEMQTESWKRQPMRNCRKTQRKSSHWPGCGSHRCLPTTNFLQQI